MKDSVTLSLSLSHLSDGVIALGGVLRVLCPKSRFIASAWGIEGENTSKADIVNGRRRFFQDRNLTVEGTFSEEVWEGC